MRDRSTRSIQTSTVIAVLCLCGTVVALQQTLVVPLLPDFPAILHASGDDTSWLVTVTLLTSAVATPVVSKLADMFGKRLMMLVCMVTMVAGSVVAAVSTDLLWLIVGRGLQGFAAALIPVGISIMRDELPREKVASAVALMSATLGIGSAVGMPLAGVIYEHLGWHAIFWTSAVAGVLLIAAVLTVVPESTVRTRGAFDYGGALLFSAALTSLLLAISKGGAWGWANERTVLLLVLAAVLLAVWAPFELRIGHPMVDIRTSARKPVLLTNIASVLVGFSMYCNMLSTTQQLQMPEISGYGFGLSVVIAGLCMLPSGIAMVLLAPVSAAITKRNGAKITLIVGSLALAVGYIARVFLTASVWQVVAGATLVSMGTAIAYAAMPTLIMRSVPITETAAANGLNTLLRAVGTSTASAVVAVVLTSEVVRHGTVLLPSLSAFQHIFWFAAVAALAAAGVAVTLPPRQAVPSAPREPGSGRVRTARTEAPAKLADDEVVVRGTVLREDGHPIPHAVVSVLRTDGEPVDWSRADKDGSYTLVLPGPGRYVVVSSADGWAPRSDVLAFTDPAHRQPIVLCDRLLLCGTVTSSSRPLAHALVSLTKPSGESLASVHADSDGHYEFPLPSAGRYIVTVVDPDAGLAQSRQVVVASQSLTVDVDTTRAREMLARA